MNERDPSKLWGAVVGLVEAVLALLLLLGVVDAGVAEAVVQIAMAAGPLAAAWLIRRQAWAPETVRRELHAAADYGDLTRQARRWLERR